MNTTTQTDELLVELEELVETLLQRLERELEHIGLRQSPFATFSDYRVKRS